MEVRIIAFSANGCELASEIGKTLFEDACTVFSKTEYAPAGLKKVDSLDEWASESMKKCDAIVFVGATGIAVRAIAPYVKDKKKDPAVVCVDDAGQYVIPLLSGHIGGANRLAERIAAGIEAVPVITTATDVHGKFAVDVFATDNNMTFRGRKRAKNISARILEGKEVCFFSEFPWSGNVPQEISVKNTGEYGIVVSARANPPAPYSKTLVLIPRLYVVGIGCRKGVSEEAVMSLLTETLSENDIDPLSIKTVASIDLKKDEVAIREVCGHLGIPTVFFTSEELNDQENIGFSRSDFVRSVTSVDCVCERAAMKASKRGRLVCDKTARDGVTIAIAREDFRIRFGDTK